MATDAAVGFVAVVTGVGRAVVGRASGRVAAQTARTGVACWSGGLPIAAMAARTLRPIVTSTMDVGPGVAGRTVGPIPPRMTGAQLWGCFISAAEGGQGQEECQERAKRYDHQMRSQ